MVVYFMVGFGQSTEMATLTSSSKGKTPGFLEVGGEGSGEIGGEGSGEGSGESGGKISRNVFDQAENFSGFWLVIVLMSCTAACLGMAISACSKTVGQGQSWVPPILIPWSIFCGFLQKPQLAHPWLRWVFSISIYEFGFQGLVVNEFKKGTFGNCDALMFEAGNCPFGAGDESKDKVLEAMDYSDSAAAQRVNRLGLGGYVLLAVVVAMVSMRRAALKQT